MARRRLAILTSGGDAPGMNTALRAATFVAVGRGWTVLGVEHGYRGLMEGAFRPLEPQGVAELYREGGTALGSARSLEFMTVEGRDKARRRLADARVDGLLVIGGNGSLAGARALADPAELGDQPLDVIGIPASIDNDVGLTGMAIGVDTAMNTIVEACDKIADTAQAHDRTFIVEVMGRDCGYLAMAAGVAVGAEVVLFPEAHKADVEVVAEVVQAIAESYARAGHHRCLIIKSEGVRIGTEALKAQVDAQLHAAGGDLAEVETRITVLGHTVRGGRPSAYDRLIASRLGHAAVAALDEGVTRAMVAWDPPRRTLPERARPSPVDPRCHLVPLDDVLAETAKLLDGTSPVVRWRARTFDEMARVLRL